MPLRKDRSKHFSGRATRLAPLLPVYSYRVNKSHLSFIHSLAHPLQFIIMINESFWAFLAGDLAEIPEEEEAFNQFSYTPEKGNDLQS